MTGAYETLEVFRESVGWLVFDRPASNGAINAVMFDELEAAWAELDADPDVSVIVNTGNGSSFQTGLDVIELAATRARCAEPRQTGGPRRMTAGTAACGSRSSWRSTACAGGNLHFVADADIAITAADAASTPRVDRPGVGVRDDGWWRRARPVRPCG